MNKFIKIPNLPTGRVIEALIDYRASLNTVQALQSLGITIHKTRETKQLYQAVSGHPDMVVHHLGGNSFVVSPENEDILSNILGINIIHGKTNLRSHYPNDIAYNAARVGKYLIHNFKYTDLSILENTEHLTRINVRQGYAKCSVCVVSENAIITSDKGIAKSCDNFGIDVLVTNDCEISLKGVSHGFIGGSTGLLAPNILAINGDIKTHPDGEKIQCFCEKYGVDVFSLKQGTIEDIGSITVLCETNT